MSYKEIWETLSAIDCTKHVEKKQNLSYLSWANALAILMEHYPEATWEYTPDKIFVDNSVEVGCTITIGECTRHMTLPVMDYKNKAMVNPSSRDISDSRMRCWVKCVALFGLGLYLYRGQDLPAKPDTPEGLTAEQCGVIWRLCMKTNTESQDFAKYLGVKHIGHLSPDKFDAAVSALNAKLEKMSREYEAGEKESNREIQEIPDGQ